MKRNVSALLLLCISPFAGCSNTKGGAPDGGVADASAADAVIDNDTGPVAEDAAVDLTVLDGSVPDPDAGMDAAFVDLGLDSATGDLGGADMGVVAFDGGGADGATCTCLDPRAECTEDGNCVYDVSCGSSSPCPDGYSCTFTALGLACQCTDESVCGKVCSEDSDCAANENYTRCHSGYCDWPISCYLWSEVASCGAEGECNVDGQCLNERRGSETGSPLGNPCSIFNHGTTCQSGWCDTQTTSAGRHYCVQPCEQNSDCPDDHPYCASGVVLHCDFSTPCTDCSGPNQYCENDGTCYTACDTTADCPGHDCQISGSRGRFTGCGTGPRACASNEIRLSIAATGASLCLVRTGCDGGAADCDAEHPLCVAAPSEWDDAPLRLCGRALS